VIAHFKPMACFIGLPRRCGLVIRPGCLCGISSAIIEKVQEIGSDIHMSVRTSISDISDYRKLCAEAAEIDEIFGRFRNHPIYKSIVETVSDEYGSQYAAFAFNKLSKNLDYMDEFRRNDLYGGPQMFQYSNIGAFSPTTLRYIKFAIDIRDLFGDLDGMRIAEIGVGYGPFARYRYW